MANESKITYVLALDATKVTEGFKKVASETAVFDKNLQIAASDLNKLAKNTELTKIAGTVAGANTKVLELTKSLSALQSKSKDFSGKSLIALQLSESLTKQLKDLQNLKTEFSKGLNLPASAADFWKAPLESARALKKEAKFDTAIKDTEKLISLADTLAARYDRLANKSSGFLRGIREAEARAILSNIDPQKFLGIDTTGIAKAKDSFKILFANLPTGESSFSKGMAQAEANAKKLQETLRRTNLEKERLEKETKRLNFYQTGFGQFTATAERLVERTPAQRNADTKAARQEYQDRLTAERQSAKEREAIATKAATLRKQQEKELADFLTNLEQDRLNKARAIAKQFFAEKKALEEQAYKDAATKANQELAAIKKAEADKLAAHVEALKDNKAWEDAKIAELLQAHKRYQAKLAADEKARLLQSQADNAAWAAGIVANWDATWKMQQLQAKQQAANAQFQAQYAPKSGVIGTATPTTLATGAVPFTSKAAQQQSSALNAVTQALNAAAQATQAFNLASNFLIPPINNLYSNFLKFVDVLRQHRQGITDSQKATLNMANSIKQEIADREALRKAYGNLNPELKKAAVARQEEIRLQAEITKLHKTFEADLAKATTAQEIQRLTNNFRIMFATLEAGYKKAVADGQAAEKNFIAQEKALARLQQKATNWSQGKQTGWARTGQLNLLQASGASKEAIQGQKIRYQLEDIDKAYEKLVNKFNTKILDPKLNPATLAKLKQGFLTGEANLLKQRDAAQQALGAIEKLTKGVHQLDQAHKPFLERIFDLVVGYRLINSAVNTFINALRSVPNMGLQYETTYATLKATFSVTAKVNEELKFLDKLAQDAGISIDSLRTSFVDFAASAKFSGEKVENINEIFANISKAGMVLHLPADKMKSAFIALNQMYAKNQVMMEELKRQLGNQLPAAVNIFALSMGKTTRQLMDDMKKGLVVPKETLLNFSRTYAAIFADPASMAYASQGVNAHIQRLSTAWTNLAVEIYEKSKGLIKGGLDVATASLEFFRTHIEGVTDVVVGLSLALGTSLVVQLGKVTLAMMATRNAAIASAGAMTALTGVSATAGSVSALATLGTYFKNIALSIPPWLRFVAVLGTAGMVLKNVEAGTTVVTSSIKTLNGQAVKLEESITIGDMVLAGWDALIAKAQKFLNIQDEIKAKAAAQNPKETRNTVVPFVAEQVARLSPLSSVGGTLVKTGYTALYALAEQAKQKEVLAREAVTQTELLNEKIKETLLAGTSGTVDETLAGVNKVVTTALGRIDKEFNATVAKIKGKTDIETIKLQGAKTNIALLEKEGAITATDAAKKKLAIQEKIYKLQMDAIDAEIKALEDKIKKEEAISQAQIDKSKEATAYQEAYKNLGIKQSFRQEIPKSLVEIGAYKSIEDAATALQNKETYKLQDTTIQRAIDQYNATHPSQGFKALEDVSEAAMKQANDNTIKTWKIYEAKMDAHASILNRVSEGVIETNRIAEEERKLFEELVAKMPQTANTFQADEASAKIGASIWGQRYFATDTMKVMSGVSGSISALKEAELRRSYETNTKYDALISQLAKQYGVDEKLVKTIMTIESRGNAGAVSKAGAAGLMQLMPATAQRFGVTNRADPRQSLEGGIKYLAFLQKMFNGDVALMAAAYNAGENRQSLKAGKIPNFPETQDYVKQVKALYQPSTSAIKSGELKSEEATLDTLNKLKEKQLEKESKGLQNQIDKEAQLREDRLAELDRINTALQNTFSLTKTRQEQELAKLQTSAVPLTETQLAAQTAAIKTKFAPELTKQIDAVIANVQEKLGRTVEEGTKQGLRSEIVNLEKERASIQAEALQAKVTVAINKVVPIQTALERKQFEIQKSLEDSLGLFNEQTFKLNQQIGQEETLKLLATEKERLKDKSNGLTQEEINKNTQLIALAEKQIAQLNQIELIKARIARERDLSASTRELADAQAANLPLNRASRMGVSGGFVGALATEEAANYKYAEKMASYQQDIAGFQAEQNIAKTTTEWNKLQTQIEQTTSAMYDLSLAKDAVLNQAVADTMDSISNHFVAWANGAEKAKDAFRGIAIDFAKMVQEIIMNELKMLAVKGIMSLITGGFSGGGSVGSLAGLGSTGATSAVGLFGFASGGQVSGKGTGTSDSIPAIVPAGSYVLNAKATAKAKRNRLINLSHGEVVFSPEQAAQIGLDNLERMNKQNFASGGLVGGTTTSTSAKAAKQNSNVYNINVAVPEGTSNAKQFGNEVGLEIMKAVAREEAKKQVNQYNKLRARG